MNNPISTATQFLLPYQNLYSQRQATIYQQEVQEPGYCYSNYCAVWPLFRKNIEIPFKSSSAFLALMDRIQAATIGHLICSNKNNSWLYLQGRAEGQTNFALIEDLNSDQLGIKTLIEKIWLNHYPLKLVFSFS